jgi:hypothetical protein
MFTQLVFSWMRIPMRFAALQTSLESGAFNYTETPHLKQGANWLVNFVSFERFALMRDSARKTSHHFLIAMHLSMHITPISPAAPARRAIGQPREQHCRSRDS